MCVWVRAGLAAGFDKNAEAVESLLGIGLGFMEIGAPIRAQPCAQALRHALSSLENIRACLFPVLKLQCCLSRTFRLGLDHTYTCNKLVALEFLRHFQGSIDRKVWQTLARRNQPDGRLAVRL